MLEHRSKINAKLWDFGNRLDDCAREIDNRKISINDLYNPLKAVTCDDMPKGSGTTSDTTLATVELIERYQMELIGYVKLKEKILRSLVHNSIKTSAKGNIKTKIFEWVKCI